MLSPLTRLKPVTLQSKQDLVLRLQAALRDFVFPAFSVQWLSGIIAQGPWGGRLFSWSWVTRALIHPINTGPTDGLTACHSRARSTNMIFVLKKLIKPSDRTPYQHPLCCLPDPDPVVQLLSTQRQLQRDQLGRVVRFFGLNGSLLIFCIEAKIFIQHSSIASSSVFATKNISVMVRTSLRVQSCIIGCSLFKNA